MTTFTINNRDVNTGAAKATRIDQPFVAAVWFEAQALHLLLPLVGLTASVTAGVGTLAIALRDGRVWGQTVADLNPDPVTWYLITGLWRASEEAKVKPLRDAILRLLVTGQVDTVTLAL